jgi:putative FmdB family regulatory protein
MPIYEYRCESCGHVFEKIQSFSAPPPESCPNCESGPVAKMISQTSFVLKGGGWYKDGYSGPSNTTGKTGGATDTSSSSSSGSSGSGGSSSSDAA